MYLPQRMLVAVVLGAAMVACARTYAGELYVGTATTSITPEEPIALWGQFHRRIGKTVESPCTATALALEVRQGDKVVDQAIMVSCDVAIIRGDLEYPDNDLGYFLESRIHQQFRQRMKDKLPGFDADKLFLNATHTHTGPVLMEGQFDIPEGVMKPSKYVEFFLDRLGDIVVKAWEGRQPGSVGWGLGHAVVAQNRRAVYADGSAVMYGKTNKPDFRGIEGYEDHGVEVLFFWDKHKKLIATAVNIACPAQEVESRSAVNADFWHQVREQLRQQYGKDLCVLGWIGAAGDQSPHLMYRKAAEERMLKLRGLTRLEEIARRIVRAVDEAYEVASKEIHVDVPMAHTVETIELPLRKVTEEERAQAQAAAVALLKQEKQGRDTRRRRLFNQKIVDRYEWQKTGPIYKMELHAIRLGDVAICTNPFELFTDFGVQIKARSKALQTFVIQIAAGPGTYLPSERAAQGGGYSAIVQSNVVGPQGGQVLVDETVKAINEMWEKK